MSILRVIELAATDGEAAESMSCYGLDERSTLMKNLDTNLRLCGFAAIVAAILIFSSARAVAQTNVQNVQVASPDASASPQTNLPNFSAVSTPADSTPPPSTSGAGLSALIALPPQNSGPPATSASPATAVAPAVSASPFVAHPDFQHAFQSNLSIGDSMVNTKPVASPAGSASPAPSASGGALSSLVATGAQNVFISPTPSPATSVIPATTNVPIQGSQVNNNPGTGITTATPGKNVTIQNSTIQGAQVNQPATATATPGNAGNAGNAGNGGFNQHPGHKIKNTPTQGAQVSTPATAGPTGNASNGGFNQPPGHKIKNTGQGQLSNAGVAGDNDGRKLHNGGPGGDRCAVSVHR